MARELKKLPSFSNVAAGNEATLNLPRGKAYHQIMVKYTGVTLTQLKNWRMEVNGKVFQKFTDGNELNQINQHWGRGAAGSGFIILHFTRSELRELVQQRTFALGTSDIDTLALRIQIDGAAADPKLEAWALRGPAAPMGYITKMKSYPVTFAAGGTHELDNLPTPATARIAAIHLLTDKVTEATLEVDGNIAFEALKALEGKLQTDAGRGQDTSKFTMDFIKENDFAQAQVLQGVQDFRIRMEVSEAVSFNVLVEYLDIRDGL